MQELINLIKKHKNFDRVGMILCHNGIVRSTSLDGREVTGLRVKADHKKLREIIKKYKEKKGIVDIQVKIFDDIDLCVGDDLMYLIVAGDIRENVLDTLEKTLNEIKSIVTQKTEFFK